MSLNRIEPVRISRVWALPITVAALLGFGGGCGREPEPQSGSAGVGQVKAVGEGVASGTSAGSSSATATATAGTRVYPLVGVVRETDAGNGTLVVRHEAIPNFMPVMTMRFEVKPADQLKDVRIGDSIEAKLHVRMRGVEIDEYYLTELVVTDYGPEPPKYLDTATGQLTTKREATPMLKPGELAPDLEVTTEAGKKLRLTELRGRVAVLTFIYTRCPLPDYCPAMDQRFRELSDLLSAAPARAEKTRLVSISFDPEFDTPEVLSRHARLRGAKPPLWIFSAASHEELLKSGARFGLMYGPRNNEIIHNLITLIIDPDGRVVRIDQGREWTAAEYLRTITETLTKSASRSPSQANPNPESPSPSQSPSKTPSKSSS